MARMLLPGDHIKSKRFAYAHHGIYLGFHYGDYYVAELAKPSGGGRVRVVPFSVFAQGSPVVEVVDHPDGVSLEQVLRNVLAMNHRRYDLWKWNCEHFATWCATNRPRSLQIEGVATAAVLALGGFLLTKLAA